MAIRKQVIQIEFLYDDEECSPDGWSIETLGREMVYGSIFGMSHVVSDDVQSIEEVRQFELSNGGDGTFMVSHEDNTI